MRVLITGGAGFIGSHLADGLLAAGHEVVLLDNLCPQIHPGGRRPMYTNSAAEFVEADIRDRELLQRLLPRVDAVYHLASLTGVGQSMYEVADYVAVNNHGTAILLEVLADERYRVKRLILGSSRAVYGEGSYECPTCGSVQVSARDPLRLSAGVWDPECPQCGRTLEPCPTGEEHVASPTSVYAVTKLSQEQLVSTVGAAYGLETVILRFFNAYGSRQSLSNPYTGILSTFFSRLQQGRVVDVYEDGGESRDFVHVTDIVQANILALENPDVVGKTVNVGTGTAATVLAIAQLMAELMDRPESVTVSGDYRVGDVRHCYADLRQAKNLLGFSPRTSLRDGIHDFITWASMQQAEDRSEEAKQDLVSRHLLRSG